MGTGLSDGFSGSIPQTNEDIELALKTGLLSLDANVLLNFYRYSPAARDALVDVLRAAGERVWVSHQAAREFWKNRISAIDGRSQALQALEAALDKSEVSLGNALDSWVKQTAVPEETKQEVLEALTRGLAEAKGLVRAEVEGAGRIAYDGASDTVLSVLSALLSGRVGPRLDATQHAEALKEGKRRAEGLIPPGYMDADKEGDGGPDGSSGDYLIWVQSIKEAVARGVPLVIVTGDEKEDWWWRHRGTLFGPRSELVEEFARHSSHPLFMLRPVQLINHADALNVAVSEDAAADVARASSDDTSAEWSSRALLELLRRLDLEGREQADVIRAAADAGGVVSRKEIYSIANYAEDRMLRGFTRPTSRITRELQEQGLLGLGVRPALTTLYDGGVMASRFAVPPEFVSLLREEGNEGEEFLGS